MILIALFAVAGTLAAAPPPMTPEQDAPQTIVVTAKARLTRSDIEKAHQFIKRVGVLHDRQQLARWVDPVCINVIGIDESYASIVVNRVKDIAAKSGVRLAAGKCKANIMVGFTDNGNDLTREIFKRSTSSFSETSQVIREKLLNGDAGIRWWYTTETRGSDGRPLALVPSIAALAGGNGGASLLPDKPTLNVYTSSAIATYGIRAITRATAIIDVHSSTGLSLNTIAEYVAMVVLAEIRRQIPPPENSVLAAFDGPTSPKRLTIEDRAFLSALYQIPLDRQSSQQRGSLAIAFAKRVE